MLIWGRISHTRPRLLKPVVYVSGGGDGVVADGRSRQEVEANGGCCEVKACV